MNADNNKPALELVGKYLAGEANAEEAMLLDDWLTHPDNQKEFDRLTKLWHQIPGTPVPEPPPAQQVWAALETRLRPARPLIFTRLLFNRYAVAAVIALLVFVPLLWFNRGKDQPPAPQQDLTWFTKAAATGIKTDSLPDGSVITLNSNSTVAYTSNFNTANREVTLNGECYFQVVHNPSQPFIITLDALKIQVIGTAFNIRKVPSNNSIEVQVQSGVVKMYTAAKDITVHKGQTGIYYMQTQDFALRDTLDVNSISYATKTFSFNDIALTEACQYLEKAFNIQIKPDTQKLAGCRLSAQFDNKPLNYILDVISATLNTTYQKQDNTIYINGNGCQ
jgi:ferric-dicitrate binding protein FerR (iron transport regulator)